MMGFGDLRSACAKKDERAIITALENMEDTPVEVALEYVTKTMGYPIISYWAIAKSQRTLYHLLHFVKETKPLIAVLSLGSEDCIVATLTIDQLELELVEFVDSLGLDCDDEPHALVETIREHHKNIAYASYEFEQFVLRKEKNRAKPVPCRPYRYHEYIKGVESVLSQHERSL